MSPVLRQREQCMGNFISKVKEVSEAMFATRPYDALQHNNISHSSFLTPTYFFITTYC